MIYLCVICMTHVNCGHASNCINCSDSIDICPICRENITSRNRLYLAGLEPKVSEKATNPAITWNRNYLTEKLPEEILLKILLYLPKKDLGNCLLVNRRLNSLSKDRILWERCNLNFQCIPAEFMKMICKNGCKLSSWL